jgi:hypothetical protein
MKMRRAPSAEMGRRRSALVAWLLCAFCVISVSIRTIIELSHQTASRSLFDLVEIFGWGLAMPAVFSVVAALIIARRPGNRVGWLLMLPALTIASPFRASVASWTTPPASLTAGMWLLLWLDFWSWIPVIFPVFLIPLHFPTGRPPTRRWSWLNGLALGMWLVFALLVMFLEEIGPNSEAWRVPNPIGFIPSSVVDSWFFALWALGLATLVLSSLASLAVRYRRAQFAERQQIKWLLFASALFALYYIVNLLIGVDDRSTGWGNLLFVISVLALPIAIAIAILRYRLYDIDLLIRRTVVYTILTATLALVYFGSVILLQSIFDTVSGEQSPIIIVASTLFIAALFSPLRRRVQGIIDRRFYRKKYDAEQILAQFAQTARDEVSLEALTTELTHVVEETMHPDSVTFWLKPSEGGNRS